MDAKDGAKRIGFPNNRGPPGGFYMKKKLKIRCDHKGWENGQGYWCNECSPEVRIRDTLTRAAVGCHEVDLVSIISERCGWKPLAVGEDMTVAMAGKRYNIRRTE